MKKGFIILLLLFAGMPMWFAACKPGKDNPAPKPELPPITQEGKNTFGCLINGEVFVPQKNSEGIECYYYDKRWNIDLAGTFSLNVRNSPLGKSLNSHIYDYVFDTGYYNIDDKIEFSKLLRTTSVYTNKNEFVCSENMYNKLHIFHRDTVERIISGTFEFDAVNKNNDKDTIKVREGRFDIIYYY